MLPAVSALPPPSLLRSPKTAAKLYIQACLPHSSPRNTAKPPWSAKLKSALPPLRAPHSKDALRRSPNFYLPPHGSSRSRMDASAITICCRRTSRRLRALNRQFQICFAHLKLPRAPPGGIVPVAVGIRRPYISLRSGDAPARPCAKRPAFRRWTASGKLPGATPLRGYSFLFFFIFYVSGRRFSALRGTRSQSEIPVSCAPLPESPAYPSGSPPAGSPAGFPPAAPQSPFHGCRPPP